MIPGNASNALILVSLASSIHSFTPPLPGVGVGVGVGIGLTLATIEATMVLIARLIVVNILTIVTPCSLNKVLILSLRVASFSQHSMNRFFDYIDLATKNSFVRISNL